MDNTEWTAVANLIDAHWEEFEAQCQSKLDALETANRIRREAGMTELTPEDVA